MPQPRSALGTAAPHGPPEAVARASAAAPPAGAGRSRRLATGVLTAGVARGVGLLAPVLLIPVCLSRLGAERYGLWMAVLALTGMAAFADLGLGAGLMTKLAPCYASGDTARARGYVSTAYAVLAAVAVTLGVLLWSLAWLVPWTSLFNVAGVVDPGETRAVVLICLTSFLVNIPLALVVRVQYAYQQVGESNLWQGAGALATVPLVLLVARLGLPAVAVVAAASAGPLLANLANSAWVYGRRMPALRPGIGAVDRRLGAALLRLGGMFFLVTVLTGLSTNMDNLIITHTLGPESVTAYAVPARLALLLGALVTVLNLPLWSANGDALARGDLAWVRRTVRRMVVLSVLATVPPAVGLVLAGDRLFAAWLPVPLDGNRWLLGGLALWFLLIGSFSALMMVQNAAGMVRPQVVGLVVYVGVAAVAKWHAVEAYGLAAVPFVGTAVYALTVLPAGLYGYRRTLARYAGPGPASPSAGPAVEQDGDAVGARRERRPGP
ncbi:oligosaccharide flippase family protein [Micromonospora sp. WMMD712]|uniref:lipopolysaccharide biosynthesis protein n=1 Tax=Micromonospora sp. WMMD712 TaxID=3016096 RepID=UPI00249A801D|nr:oligosaccharide flippase family protein [Micromonospora sp. WMMD712]WFE61023.1 oligosaccharide flippase family protein [Micromonospora sp. WMMD712]